MTNFPKHLYLQSNIKPTQKTTVRQDSRIQGTSAGPTQRPNYAIPLLDWINERVRENDIILPETNCNCPEPECNLPIVPDVLTSFKDNGLTYQFIDILQYAVFDKNNPITITLYPAHESLLNPLSGNRAVELVETPFYPYPIIKLTKPSDSANVNNIDVEEEFAFEIEDSCGKSRLAKTTIQIVNYNLDDFINYLITNP